MSCYRHLGFLTEHVGPTTSRRGQSGCRSGESQFRFRWGQNLEKRQTDGKVMKSDGKPWECVKIDVRIPKWWWKDNMESVLKTSSKPWSRYPPSMCLLKQLKESPFWSRHVTTWNQKSNFFQMTRCLQNSPCWWAWSSKALPPIIGTGSSLAALDLGSDR